MKALIIGTGWYGCHLATLLSDNNIEFDITDKSNKIFTGSSSKNQNRLHLGFHYPRSHKTREECKKGFYKFIERYGFLTEEVENNIYLVSKYSLIDYKTYKHIYEYEKYDFKIVDLNDLFDLEKTYLDGFGICTKEQLINFNKGKQHFEKLFLNKLLPFEDNLHLNTQYDIVFDCTYGQNLPIRHLINYDCYYEVCLGWLYTSSSHINSYIVMDGEFFSIFPFDDNLFLLTHVKHTPYMQTDILNDNTHIAENESDRVRKLVEDDVKNYIPNFAEIYKYHSYYCSIKTKFDNQCADRSLQTFNKGKYHSFIGGKITGIFEMEQYVRDLL